MVTAMSLPKLSDTDKQELVDLYRQTSATTTTLAKRFGVSISTVSRLLKTAIAATEYESLVLEKRSSRVPQGNPQLFLPLTETEKSNPGEQRDQEASPINIAAVAEVNVVEEEENKKAENIQDKASGKRRRTRSSKKLDSDAPNPEVKPEIKKVIINPPAITVKTVELPDNLIEEMQGWEVEPELVPAITPRPQIVSIKSSALDEIVKDIDEDFVLDEDEEDLDDDLDDLSDDDEEDDDGNEEDYFPEPSVITDKSSANGFVSILPFAGVTMPKHCYLVVDNRGDLVVRPLNEFGLGGTVPPTELKEKTLPIFDNHRVARRFSLRTQKVIKIPNGDIVQKTTQALKAKGITRVFINGKVYAL